MLFRSQVRSKLSAAVDCRRGERIAKNSEAKFAVPASLPESAAERCRLFKFLSKNPDAKIPPYLSFGNLDETGRAMLAYALLERGESAAEALAFEPKSEAFAVAFAAVFSREGKNILRDGGHGRHGRKILRPYKLKSHYNNALERTAMRPPRHTANGRRGHTVHRAGVMPDGAGIVAARRDFGDFFVGMIVLSEKMCIFGH